MPACMMVMSVALWLIPTQEMSVQRAIQLLASTVWAVGSCLACVILGRWR